MKYTVQLYNMLPPPLLHPEKYFFNILLLWTHLFPNKEAKQTQDLLSNDFPNPGHDPLGGL